MQRAEDAERLDRMFHALADQSRRGMLDRLAKGPASVSELAEPLELALPSVVKLIRHVERGFHFDTTQKTVWHGQAPVSAGGALATTGRIRV